MQAKPLTSFLLCFCCALHTGGVIGQELRKADESGFIYLPGFVLDSYTSQNYRMAGTVDPTLSNETALFSFLLNDEVGKELELTAPQRKRVVELEKEYVQTKKELTQYIARRRESKSDDRSQVDEQKRFSSWVQRHAEDFQQKFDELLLPHQKEMLERIQANYLVALVGHAAVARYATEAGIAKFKPTTIDRLSNAEKRLAPKLAEKCGSFQQVEMFRGLKILSEAQSEAALHAIQKAKPIVLPELMAVQASELDSAEKSKALGPYAVWKTSPRLERTQVDS